MLAKRSAMEIFTPFSREVQRIWQEAFPNNEEASISFSGNTLVIKAETPGILDMLKTAVEEKFKRSKQRLKISNVIECGSAEDEISNATRRDVRILFPDSGFYLVIEKDSASVDKNTSFLEQIRSVVPNADGVFLTVINDVAIFQAAKPEMLFKTTDTIRRKLGIASDVMSVGTPEEIKFRAGVTDDIAKLLPTEGAYAVVRQKSADKPAA